MENKQYLLVQSDDKDENNIAVIVVSINITPKLQIALSEHFDYDVTVDNLELISDHPLCYKAECSYIDEDEEPQEFICELNETWLY
jgi:hypothetical protein